MKRLCLSLILLLLAMPASAADGPTGPSWLNILMLVIVMGLLMAGVTEQAA